MLKTIIQPTPPATNPNFNLPTATATVKQDVPQAQDTQLIQKLPTILQKPMAIGMLTLGIIALGIVTALLLSTQNQDSRKDASVGNGTVELSVSPTTKNIAPDESSSFTVSLNTNGKVIGALSARLSYPFSGAAPQITASNPNVVNSQWTCNIKKTEIKTSQVNIDVGCTASGNPPAYSNTTAAPLFSFTVTAGQTATTTPITIAFDTTQTIAVDANNNDIAMIPRTNAVINVTGSSVAPTATPTPTRAAASPTATPTPTTATAGPTATPTPTTASDSNSTHNYSCNHTCTANRDCQSDLACLSGYCRDPRCSSDTSCDCDNLDVASKTNTTSLPKSGGVSYTILLSILGGLLVFSGINFALWVKNQN